MLESNHHHGRQSQEKETTGKCAGDCTIRKDGPSTDYPSVRPSVSVLFVFAIVAVVVVNSSDDLLVLTSFVMHRALGCLHIGEDESSHRQHLAVNPTLFSYAGRPTGQLGWADTPTIGENVCALFCPHNHPSIWSFTVLIRRPLCACLLLWTLADRNGCFPSSPAG
ncbi:hypothetical protein KIN20_003358 [Parelaphostrongylus tenuis]|uniref:Uncharacterized protein n=1 Tax=Parelaphostrongylus tenuis TaxID=148309 RepID=A0AAD5QG04_PARTN|nr:hypothetical protein KIN20_003358 [Parelaphostrongylus tenuis]